MSHELPRHERNKLITQRAVSRVENGDCPFLGEETLAAHLMGYTDSMALGRFPNSDESKKLKILGRKQLLKCMEGTSLVRVAVPFPHVWLDLPLPHETHLISPETPIGLAEEILISFDLMTRWMQVKSRNIKGEPWHPGLWALEHEKDPFTTWVYTTQKNLDRGCIIPVEKRDGQSGVGGVDTIQLKDLEVDKAQERSWFLKLIRPYPGAPTVTAYEMAFQRFVLNTLVSKVFLTSLIQQQKAIESGDEQLIESTTLSLSTFQWCSHYRRSTKDGSRPDQIYSATGFTNQCLVGSERLELFYNLGPLEPDEVGMLSDNANDRQIGVVFTCPVPISNAEKLRMEPKRSLFEGDHES